jgi:hypothetical protein
MRFIMAAHVSNRAKDIGDAWWMPVKRHGEGGEGVGWWVYVAG